MDPEEHGLSDQFLPSLEDKLTLLQVPALARNGSEGCASHTPSCSVSILLSFFTEPLPLVWSQSLCIVIVPCLSFN